MALTHLVVQYESNFCSVALQFMEEEKNYPLPSPATTGTAPPLQSLQSPTWPSARRGPLSEPFSGPSVLLRAELRYQVPSTQTPALSGSDSRLPRL